MDAAFSIINQRNHFAHAIIPRTKINAYVTFLIENYIAWLAASCQNQCSKKKKSPSHAAFTLFARENLISGYLSSRLSRKAFIFLFFLFGLKLMPLILANVSASLSVMLKMLRRFCRFCFLFKRLRSKKPVTIS